MHDLSRVQRMLRRWLDVCHRAERTGRCGVLEGQAGPREGNCGNPAKGP